VREERIVLEDHADAAVFRLDESTGTGNLDPRQRYPPALRPLDAGHDPQQRRFPGTGRPEQEQDLAGGDVEGDVVERDEGTEGEADVLQGDGQGRGRRLERADGRLERNCRGRRWLCRLARLRRNDCPCCQQNASPE
jgi:hypothetical protein